MKRSIIVIIGLSATATTRADTLNVPGDFGTIQKCIDAGVSGVDECVVAPGTYNEVIDFNGKAVTLRSAGGPEVTTIDGTGLNDSVVKCVSGEGPDTVLKGFTITGGTGTVNGIFTVGGGMFNDGGSPTVTNCTFRGNSASLYGGGMYNSGASPTVTNCTFSGNSASHGGGMAGGVGSPTVTNCTFAGNNAFQGGGMYSNEGSQTVTNCTFTGNSAEEGGGMFNVKNVPTVTNCTFTGNTAEAGGGMYNLLTLFGLGLGGRLTNCTFTGNSASTSGGGMFNDLASPPVTNCTFSGNSANLNGGGMYNLKSSPTATNCTFSGNGADSGGGGMFNTTNSNSTVINCILWANPDGSFAGPGTPTVTYTDIQGGFSGTGNIDADPLFVDADGPDDTPGTDDDNLRLLPGSPCIDAGDNNADIDNTPGVQPLPDTDLDGNARIVNGTVDMGAYEFQAFGEPIPTLSEWGLVVLVLLLLSGLKIYFGRRRPACI